MGNLRKMIFKNQDKKLEENKKVITPERKKEMLSWINDKNMPYSDLCDKIDSLSYDEKWEFRKLFYTKREKNDKKLKKCDPLNLAMYTGGATAIGTSYAVMGGLNNLLQSGALEYDYFVMALTGLALLFFPMWGVFSMPFLGVSEKHNTKKREKLNIVEERLKWVECALRDSDKRKEVARCR